MDRPQKYGAAMATTHMTFQTVLTPRRPISTEWPMMRVWPIKNSAANNRPALPAIVAGLRRSPVRMTVRPSQSKMTVSNSDTACAPA